MPHVPRNRYYDFDANKINYLPSEIADWVGNPGTVQFALDELVDRVYEIEINGPVGNLNASFIIYVPSNEADACWEGSSDPANVSDALDQIALRLCELESLSGIGGSPIAYLDTAQIFTASQIFRPTNSSSIGIVVSGLASQSGNLQEWQTNTPITVASVSANGDWAISPVVRTSGSPTGLVFTGASHTTLGGEATDVNFNLNRTINTTTTVAHWRAFRIQGPTISYANPQSVSQISTLAVSAPNSIPTGASYPTSGIWAINIESGGMKISPGNISFSGNTSTHNIFCINATGNTVGNITSGSTNNDILFDLSRTITWSTSVPATNNSFAIIAPTYACTSGPVTMTRAATLSISGAPVAGSNVSITNRYSFFIESGNLGILNQGELHLYEATANGSNKLIFKSVSNLTADSTYTWPALSVSTPLGAGHNVLVSDSGILSWELLTNAQIGQQIYNEVPTGTVNGSNALFSVANGVEAGTLRVYKNGLRQKPGIGYDYTLSGQEITFESGNIPQTGDVILVDYVNDGVLV